MNTKNLHGDATTRNKAKGDVRKTSECGVDHLAVNTGARVDSAATTEEHIENRAKDAVAAVLRVGREGVAAVDIRKAAAVVDIAPHVDRKNPVRAAWRAWSFALEEVKRMTSDASSIERAHEGVRAVKAALWKVWESPNFNSMREDYESIRLNLGTLETRVAVAQQGGEQQFAAPPRAEVVSLGAERIRRGLAAPVTFKLTQPQWSTLALYEKAAPVQPKRTRAMHSFYHVSSNLFYLGLLDIGPKGYRITDLGRVALASRERQSVEPVASKPRRRAQSVRDAGAES